MQSKLTRSIGKAEIHRDLGPSAFSAGGVGFVNAHLKRLQNDYLVRSEDGRIEKKNICCVMTTLFGCP